MSEKNIQELTSDEIKFPNSTKIYVTTNGDTNNAQKIELNVPFREIALSPTRNMADELEENSPVRVYDTSGVYTDESVKCDVREGLPTLRRDWIIGRGDVEEYVGREILPQDNGYLTKGAEEFAKAKPSKDGTQNEEFPALKRPPLRAKSSLRAADEANARAAVAPLIQRGVRCCADIGMLREA